MTFDGGGTDAQFDRDLFVGPGERNETQNSPFRCGHFGHGCRHPLAAAVDSIQEIGGVLRIFLTTFVLRCMLTMITRLIGVIPILAATF
jgi:hypothetical protein